MKTIIGFVKGGMANTRWLFIMESTGQLFTGKIPNEALITVGQVYDDNIYDTRPATPKQIKKLCIELYLLRPLFRGHKNVRWLVLFNVSECSYLFPNNSTYKPFSTEYGQLGKLGKKYELHIA